MWRWPSRNMIAREIELKIINWVANITDIRVLLNKQRPWHLKDWSFQCSVTKAYFPECTRYSDYNMGWTIGVRIQVEARDFSPLQNVHTGFEAQPASQSMGTGVLSQGLNGRGVKLVPRLRMSAALPVLPYTPSWENFNFISHNRHVWLTNSKVKYEVASVHSSTAGAQASIHSFLTLALGAGEKKIIQV